MTASEARLLDIAAAAEYLAVRESYVRRLIRERRVAVVKIGRHVRFEIAALDSLIESGRVAAKP